MTGEIPESSYNMMLRQYTDEKKVIENQLEQITTPQTENINYKETGVLFLNHIKNTQTNLLLDYDNIYALIQEIRVWVDNSKGKYLANKPKKIIIIYKKVDDLIKEFIDYESNR